MLSDAFASVTYIARATEPPFLKMTGRFSVRYVPCAAQWRAMDGLSNPGIVVSLQRENQHQAHQIFLTEPRACTIRGKRLDASCDFPSANRENMPTSEMVQLAMLLKQERPALLAQWRHELRQLPSARQLDTPTLNDHMPGFLDELVSSLLADSEQTIPEVLAGGSAPAHGSQRFTDGFDIVEVVAEYNLLRGCIHDLADTHHLQLQGEPFRVLNQVLDGAIGLAVSTLSAQRALEVQQRREDYLAFVAHDLRTPLAAISMAAEVIELKLPADPNAPSVESRMLKSLRRNVQQLKTLVAKILDENLHLQTQAGLKIERREFDLWSLVESVVQDLQAVALANATRLINDVPDELVVYADAPLLRRVFQNLIANAIRYTPQGDVTLGARDLGGVSGVECWVRDTGAGISEELLDRVFDKGQTAPENTEGTGLGLALVRSVIEAHGGIVEVQSQLGSGSTFRFSLPRKP